MLDWKDGEVRFDVGELFDSDNELGDEDRQAMVSKITEKDMGSLSKKIGFSLDFSKMIVRLDSENAIELYTKGVDILSKAVANELGLDGYFHSIDRGKKD